MSRHHRTAHHTARAAKLRPRVQAQINAGTVACWRCGQPILPGQPWDLGHMVDLADGGNPNDMRPEHRHRTGGCPGNRSAGGQRGAALTNSHRRTERRLPNW